MVTVVTTLTRWCEAAATAAQLVLISHHLLTFTLTPSRTTSSMSTPLAQNHDENVFLTVTLSPTSTLYNDPDGLAAAHPLVRRLGRVGQLQDVQVLSVPRQEWPRVEGEVMDALNALPGVLRVDVQEKPRARVKRGGDEL
ncbi:hypothetical protein PYCCODRAFT_443607 [Trametes coccinea BRFM310]|uniref:Uncharacterized protein n=1 Tax=Trametes coccinea (strain BRFM310) TaxID=1353009 RepID=A0A1Y2IM07_TRAC3|nr:hypothetical protein PYCCODRAFT_443607 [Trametes coccinea BRFM310]